MRLRANFVFLLVPMLNPDGVISGNNRCGLGGHDLNRRYLETSQRMHPTIYYLKRLVKVMHTHAHFHSSIGSCMRPHTATYVLSYAIYVLMHICRISLLNSLVLTLTLEIPSFPRPQATRPHVIASSAAT
jgi:hypothetical protein